MKRHSITLAVFSGLVLTSCREGASPDQVVSQTFVHKYGFNVSQEEWDARSQDGQIVEQLKSGVKVTRTYENGQLHGPTSYTYPNSSVVEKVFVYDQGNLLKETAFDETGVSIREDLYEFDDRNVITLWSNRGIPLSVEEYENHVLVEGKYYSPDHELEAKVEGGNGERTKRTREGILVSKDRIHDGALTERASYHPNGELHTLSHYENYQLHGPQVKYAASGRPLMELAWKHGVMDGQKILYRNGMRVAEIPYVEGVKHGTEYHYDDLGNMISETVWVNDKKHGCSKSYHEEGVDVAWFHHGMEVDAQKFMLLESREELLAEMNFE